MADLSGKSIVVLSNETALTQAIQNTLVADGAAVSILDITEATEPAWESGLLRSDQRPEKIDAIVNVAVPDAGGAMGDVSLQRFRSILESSYVRSWLAHKYGILAMRETGGGAFITVTSVDGLLGAPAAVASCAVSRGLVQMTRSAAVECAEKRDGVRVNAVLVGDIMPGEHDSYTPGHVSPSDVGEAVAHLASDAAIYITGLLMPLDNGGRLPS